MEEVNKACEILVAGNKWKRPPSGGTAADGRTILKRIWRT